MLHRRLALRYTTSDLETELRFARSKNEIAWYHGKEAEAHMGTLLGWIKAILRIGILEFLGRMGWKVLLGLLAALAVAIIVIVVLVGLLVALII